jgi:hypothetical protein
MRRRHRGTHAGRGARVMVAVLSSVMAGQASTARPLLAYPTPCVCVCASVDIHPPQPLRTEWGMDRNTRPIVALTYHLGRCRRLVQSRTALGCQVVKGPRQYAAGKARLLREPVRGGEIFFFFSGRGGGWRLWVLQLSRGGCQLLCDMAWLPYPILYVRD